MGGSAGSCTADTDNDENNCGACGHVCSTDNASSTKCDQGVCKPTCNADFDDCNTPDSSTADDGCEANLKQDGENCSTCGRSCQGGECSGGACQPLVLYEGSVSGGRGLGVSADEVFFTDNTDATVYAIAKSGGQARTVAENQIYAFYLRVVGSNVYWTTGQLSQGGISTTTTTQGNPIVPLASGIESPDSFEVGGGFVFWQNYAEPKMHSIPAAGGSVVDFQEAGNSPRYYNGRVYYTASANNGSIRHVSSMGGIPVDFATNIQWDSIPARYMFLEGNVAFYSESNAASEVFRVNQSGAPAPVSGGHRASVMTLSSGWVFWAEWGTPDAQANTTPGIVWGVPTTGGQPVKITDVGGFATTMVADDDAIYYATRLQYSPSNYSILKIARPQ